MTLPFTFTGATAATGADLDEDFNAVGLLGTIPCSVAGTNSLTLTPYTIPTIGTPPVTLQAQLRFSGIAVATNSGATTVNVAGTGALNVYKDTGSGPVALSGNEIILNNYFVLAYDAALNTGSGGYHLQTAPANAAGTVTSLVSGTGISGGTITTTGTIALASASTKTIKSNVTGGSAVPSDNTLTAILDAIMSSTQGAILSRGASLWAASTETSWTPAVAFGGSSTGITYSTQVGQYMSIGYLVVAMFNLVLTNKGSQTGAATVSLPLAAGGTSRVGSGWVSNYSNLTSVTTFPWLNIAASATTASLLIAGSATVSSVADTNFANNTTIQGLMVYFSG